MTVSGLVIAVNSPDVNTQSLFSCFAESPKSKAIKGHTLKAFIFSLKSIETLPPFKCLAEKKDNAIYKRSTYGPSFGRGPFVYIDQFKEALARIGTPYSLPIEVNKEDSRCVLAGTKEIFSPDNYEVFYLA